VFFKTNYPAFKSTEFTITRRFSDFLALYDKLKEKHLHAGHFLPPQPEKDMIGTARVKMSKEDTTPINFIEKRRAALERFLNRCGHHKSLKYDPDFRDFLEVPDGFSKSVNTSALSGAGVFKMFKSVSDSVTKIAIKIDETDAWFEEKTHQIDALHHQYKKMHSIVEMMHGWRKDLAHSTKDFSKSISILSNSEEQLSLSRALSHLGESYEKIEQHYLDQSNSDYFLFAELLKDYICLYDNIKEVFHQRVKIYSHWKKAEETLKAKEDYKVKLEATNKLDKVPAAAAEIRDWSIKVEKSKEDFENISKEIKEEMKRFDYNRSKEFKETLIKYLEKLLTNQEAVRKRKSFY
jgi:sorting nexin-1/2